MQPHHDKCYRGFEEFWNDEISVMIKSDGNFEDNNRERRLQWNEYGEVSDDNFIYVQRHIHTKEERDKFCNKSIHKYVELTGVKEIELNNRVNWNDTKRRP